MEAVVDSDGGGRETIQSVDDSVGVGRSSASSPPVHLREERERERADTVVGNTYCCWESPPPAQFLHHSKNQRLS